MKVILISMPDVAPILIHEAAVHLPNHGIASVGEILTQSMRSGSLIWSVNAAQSKNI